MYPDLPTPLIIIFLVFIVLGGLIALYGIFTKRRRSVTDNSPELKEETHPVAPRSFYKLKIAGDFLQFIGMRITVDTEEGKSFTGLLHDLSDSGSHLILKDVQEGVTGGPTKHHDRVIIPISSLNFIEVVDRRGKLP